MALAGEWYTEIGPNSGSAFSLKINKKLHEENTDYQLLEIYETETFGNLMTLDGMVMLCDRDHFIYHEMMTHPALFSHPHPRNVLIVGGGDCGSLFEVLKHDTVVSVDQVELDERITRVSEQFFPDLCQSNDDPRVNFQFNDGIHWLAETEADYYDVIIIDSTDPVGPAVGLFSEAFYQSCLKALGPQGILIAQSESPLFHLDILSSMHQAMAGAGFNDIATLQFPQCSYPSGWWSATMASKNSSLSNIRRQDCLNKKFATRFYNLAIHEAALAQPEFLQDSLHQGAS